MPLDLSRALPYLVPAVSAEETAPIHAFGSADAPVSRSFSTTLNVQYMVDEPGALVLVRERDIDRERRLALHARSLENLRAQVQRRKLRFDRGASGASHIAR